MEKINRIRISLISIIVIALIATAFTLLLTSLWNLGQPKLYTSAYTTREMWKYPCLEKGNVCTINDIIRSIKVSIPVNDKEKKVFYLISNDKDTATFIMDSNLVDQINWYGERINLKGPITALTSIGTLTDNWTNIPIIEDYEYLDEGKAYYEDLCSVDFGEDPKIYYDCTDQYIPTRGYNGLTIKKGILNVKYNLPEEEEDEMIVTQEGTFREHKLRARLPELKELQALRTEAGYPDWLIDNLREKFSYWTMSSSTLQISGYMQGAWGVINEEGIANIKEFYTKNDSNGEYKNVGIRPIITINKTKFE